MRILNKQRIIEENKTIVMLLTALTTDAEDLLGFKSSKVIRPSTPV